MLAHTYLDIVEIRALRILIHVLAQVQLHIIHNQVQSVIVPQHVSQPVTGHKGILLLLVSSCRILGQVESGLACTAMIG